MSTEYTFASTARVLNALSNVQAWSLDLHNGFVALMTEIRDSYSKKDVVMSQDLAAIFSHEMKGLDRKRFLSWVVTYTPIRPKFKQNGQFEKIGFARKAGADAWDLEGAKANPWYSHDAAKTTKARAANVNNALAALALVIAKDGVEKSLRGQGGLLDVLASVRDFVNSPEFNAAISQSMDTPKFLAWVEERQQIIEEEKRNAPKRNDAVMAEIIKLAA